MAIAGKFTSRGLHCLKSLKPLYKGHASRSLLDYINYKLYKGHTLRPLLDYINMKNLHMLLIVGVLYTVTLSANFEPAILRNTCRDQRQPKLCSWCNINTAALLLDA